MNRTIYRRQSPRAVVRFLKDMLPGGSLKAELGDNSGVGIVITDRFRRKLGNPPWGRFVEGRLNKLTTKTAIIQSGKITTRVPLSEIMQTYIVGPV